MQNVFYHVQEPTEEIKYVNIEDSIIQSHIHADSCRDLKANIDNDLINIDIFIDQDSISGKAIIDKCQARGDLHQLVIFALNGASLLSAVHDDRCVLNINNQSDLNRVLDALPYLNVVRYIYSFIKFESQHINEKPDNKGDGPIR